MRAVDERAEAAGEKGGEREGWRSGPADYSERREKKEASSKVKKVTVKRGLAFLPGRRQDPQQKKKTRSNLRAEGKSTS